MRNGQNNNKQRMRGRNNNNNNNRKSQNPMTRVYESNGPDVKVRGTASHVAEKYMQLARDSQTSGDPVAAENYFQHAEHYLRMIAAVQEQFRQQNPFYRDGETREGAFDDGDGDDGDGNNFRQGEGQHQQHQQREQQHQQYQQREQQPQQHREQHGNREHRPNREPRYENREPFQGNRPQPPAPASVDDNVDRLPAFVTGGPPPASSPPMQNGANGQGGFDGSADRFPLHRRRRRRHGPRPEMSGGQNEGEPTAAPQTPSGPPTE
jgi:hypothetical protein